MIREYIILLRANQIAEITSDFIKILDIIIESFPLISCGSWLLVVGIFFGGGGGGEGERGVDFPYFPIQDGS